MVGVPLYEYRCNDCSSTFVMLRPFADRELSAVCPGCESRTTMPLISRVSALSGVRPDGTAGLPAMRASAAPSGGCCGGGCGCG
jgi:putative FmdB family regulatory protein